MPFRDTKVGGSQGCRRWPGLWALLVCLALLGAANTARGADSCEVEYRKINQLIGSGFSTGVAPKLPAALEFSVSRAEGGDYLKAAGKLWSEYWPDQSLVRSLKDAEKAGKVTPEVLLQLKQARGRLKVIRFLCEAICDDHRSPSHLDSLVKSLGKVEEIQAFSGEPAKVTKAIDGVLSALDDKPMGKVMKEIAHLSPASGQDNERWLAKALELVANAKDRTDLSVEEYHEVRKTLGRIQTVVLMDATKAEDPQRLAAYEWLRQLYNKIGAEHDDMVKAEFEDATVDETQFKPELRRQLGQMLKALQ